MINSKKIDKQKIYAITTAINNTLHTDFGMSDIKDRMVFTGCALIAEQSGANLKKQKDEGYKTFHTKVHTTLEKILAPNIARNPDFVILNEVFEAIKMNIKEKLLQ